MRTIKFRGKRLHDGKWVYGYLLGHDTLPCMAIVTMNNTHKSVINKTTTSVEPDTIGQFTGLYDKDGKEIYEGDILRYSAKDKFDEENFVSFEVFWHDNDCADNHVGWQMDRRHFHGNICGARELSRFLPKYTKKMVIIGNIHDNPKLIEQ